MTARRVEGASVQRRAAHGASASISIARNTDLRLPPSGWRAMGRGASRSLRLEGRSPGALGASRVSCTRPSTRVAASSSREPGHCCRACASRRAPPTVASRTMPQWAAARARAKLVNRPEAPAAARPRAASRVGLQNLSSRGYGGGAREQNGGAGGRTSATGWFNPVVVPRARAPPALLAVLQGSDPAGAAVAPAPCAAGRA